MGIILTALPFSTESYDGIRGIDQDSWCSTDPLTSEAELVDEIWTLIIHYVPGWLVFIYIFTVYLRVWRLLHKRDVDLTHPIEGLSKRVSNPERLISKTRIIRYPTVFI